MTTSPSSPQAFEFGGFLLEPLQQRLSGADQQPIALTPKAFDTLLCLVERSGELVTKSELLSRVWPNVVVEEAILARNVADLRKALGDDAEAPRFIETLPKRGYRFVARVTSRASLSPRTGGTVDTLQLISEHPADRGTESVVDAPELNRPATSPAAAWKWIAGLGLATALIAGIWLLLR